MLQQDLGAQQDQDHTAGDLRFFLKAATEDIADLHTGCAERAGAQTDQDHGDKNAVNNKVERSLISKEYANRFIREFVL